MRTIHLHLLVVLTAMLSFSCGSSDDGGPNEQPPTIIDDYNVVAVSDYGQIFKIGNNTGAIVNIGQINRVNDNSFLVPSSLIASATKIYAMEFVTSPSPTNNLLIYDKQSGTTQIVTLNIPDAIPGDEKFVGALLLNGTNLMGVMAETSYASHSPKHIININLQDYTITDTGITFNEDPITSMKQLGSKLYVSTWGEGFMEIDLNTNAVNYLEFNNAPLHGGKMAVISNSELGIMQQSPGFVNGAKPMKINLATQSLSEQSGSETVGLPIVFGNSIYKNQEYLNLISTNTLYMGLLKVNYQTNVTSVVTINSTTVSRNLVIVDTVE